MTKFEQVMHQLQDSVNTARTIEGVEWCQVKKAELEALLFCAKSATMLRYGYLTAERAISAIEACADE